MNKALLLTVILSMPFIFSQAVSAKCMAEVDVQNFWEERHGFDQNAKLKVTIESARPGAYVRVHVKARYHYERSDGWTNRASTSDSVGIDTSDHSSETFGIDTRARNCSKDQPCEINDVEITDISCHD